MTWETLLPKVWLLAAVVGAVLLPAVSAGQSATVISSFDFNSGTSYETLAPNTAPGVTATAASTEPFATGPGSGTGSNSFTSVATAGQALAMSNSSGTNTRYFQFALAGSNLRNYFGYKLYFQPYRSATGATTITVAYSTDGGNSFATVPTTVSVAEGSFAERILDLSGLTDLDNKAAVVLRLLVSGATSGSGTFRLDNFQVQASSFLNPVPGLTALSPASLPAGSNGFTLTVTGSGFTPASVVRFNGADRPTTFSSATQLTAAIPASDVATAGTFPVTVVTPAPGGGTSGSLGFVVAPVKRWDGGAGTNSWFDALNWDTDAVPTSTDDVLLDHSSVVGRYTVVLDAGGAVTPATTPSVEVRSLTLNPAAGDSILVEVSALNTAAVPLRLTRTGATETALALYSKGVLTNSSDVGSIDAAGSAPTFYLYNGGTYRHYTDRPHVALLENLAAVAGTEAGTWEFRAKTQSSNTPSIAGRTYPNLVFRNRLGQPVTNYTGSGANPLTIRGNLIVGPGAVFTASTTSEIRVAGDITVQGAFRFQPQTSGTTTVRLVLNGGRPQRISGMAWGTVPATATGTYLAADVPLQINNTSAEGVTLATPVTVNNVLQLTAGRLNSTATNVLTLLNQPSGGSNTSFVNGPVARPANGAATLTFPLGRIDAQGGSYRPLTLNITSLNRATTFIATQTEGGFATKDLQGDLRRLNATRYFTVNPEPTLTAADNFSGTITLSFGPDDLVADPAASSLVIAKNDGNGWVNIGRSGHTGTASNGAYVAGTLTSGSFASFSHFTLASTSASATPNPLPVTLLRFQAEPQPTGVHVTWTTAAELNNDRFEVQRSLDGHQFTTLATLQGRGTSTTAHQYSWLDASPPPGLLYYRLRQLDTDGTSHFSSVVVARSSKAVALYPNPVREQLVIEAAIGVPYRVLDLLGQVVLSGQTGPAGSTRLHVQPLRPGLYYLELEGSKKTARVPFYKQ
ncbi:T9SS type A sorting domain-containing protein [Hymenobacter sp. HSC-4F20]|uniref:IPT/TIG domain-containing protein n=1 Tax=Hymenobacter sp. HSC-4F20 TaxID=2864135 RepID=UPI001C730C73|nr:IPT/TIG domain-containing protein [Hymenobacter sp. HSC-4F20]MBX0291333.1 T9SS type A sorting domain-containing protein [Hymenobacter sp. HSC-4F20]